MDLLLKKLLQSSKSGIELLLAIAGTVVQVLATAVAKTFAVLLAQQLGIQIQDKDCPYNIIQIGAVSLQREYPLIFVLFVGKLRYQHHIDGKLQIGIEIRSAAVANAMDGGVQGTGHHQDARGIAHGAFGQDRLTDGVALTIEKIAQIKGITAEEVARVTSENACRLFQIEL